MEESRGEEVGARERVPGGHSLAKSLLCSLAASPLF